jgi:peptidyl-prolyl cis-trans isomerase D
MHKKGAGILAIVLIGLIILSFLFTGYYTSFGTSNVDVITTVDDEPIRIDEFQRALQQRIEFFRQLSGGQDISAKQLEQLGIKSAILSGLVDQKLLIKLSKELNLYPSQIEIAYLIQEQKFFHRGDIFDFELYQKILNANGLTSALYEKNVAEGLMTSRIQEILNRYPQSQQFEKELESFQEKKILVDSIHIKKDSLKKTIVISEEEISKFLRDKSNLSKIEAKFLLQKDKLGQEEQVKARHILLKMPNAKNDEEKQKLLISLQKSASDLFKNLTTSNFEKMAKEKTEDPNGKDNGGDLGWFGRGSMLPEFEAVVFTMKKGSISQPFLTSYGYHIVLLEDKKEEKKAEFKNYQSSLAKEFLQEHKTEELKSIELNFVKKAEAWLQQKQTAAIKEAEKNLSLEWHSQQEINALDGAPAHWNLEEKQMDRIFHDSWTQNKEAVEKVYTFSNAGDIILIKSYGVLNKLNLVDAKKIDNKKESPTKLYEGQLVQDLRKVVMESLQKNAKIKHHQKI